jgi:hypothetical protein
MPKLQPDYPGNRKPPRFAYLRSFLPVLALLLVFSFFLASYSLLSHYKSPAGKQHLGWQSWDVVQLAKSHSEQEQLSTNGTGVDEDFMPSIPIDNWVSRPQILIWLTY